MTSARALQFPVLTISRRGFAYAVRDEVALQAAQALALRSRQFDGLRIIDAGGMAHRVARTFDARITDGEWIRGLLGALTDRRVTVQVEQLELEPDHVLTLEETKDEVRTAVRKLAHVDEEAVGGMRSLLARVNGCRSIPEVIACFLEYV